MACLVRSVVAEVQRTLFGNSNNMVLSTSSMELSKGAATKLGQRTGTNQCGSNQQMHAGLKQEEHNTTHTAGWNSMANNYVGPNHAVEVPKTRIQAVGHSAVPPNQGTSMQQRGALGSLFSDDVDIADIDFCC